jgi:hypothetical protein
MLAQVTFGQGPLPEASIGLGTLQVRYLLTSIHNNLLIVDRSI